MGHGDLLDVGWKQETWQHVQDVWWWVFEGSSRWARRLVGSKRHDITTRWRNRGCKQAEKRASHRTTMAMGCAGGVQGHGGDGRRGRERQRRPTVMGKLPHLCVDTRLVDLLVPLVQLLGILHRVACSTDRGEREEQEPIRRSTHVTLLRKRSSESAMARREGRGDEVGRGRGG
jgi:hypothetical protein